MEITVLGQDFEDLTCLICEQTVVGNDDGGTPSLLQDRHDVLQEIELLVACRDREVVAVGRLVRALGAERWIRQNNIESPAVRHFIDRIAYLDVGFEVMQVEVHKRDAPRPLRESMAK